MLSTEYGKLTREYIKAVSEEFSCEWCGFPLYQRDWYITMAEDPGAHGWCGTKCAQNHLFTFVYVNGGDLAEF